MFDKNRRCSRCGLGLFISDFGEPLCLCCGYRPGQKFVPYISDRVRYQLTEEPLNYLSSTSIVSDPLMSDIAKLADGCQFDCISCYQIKTCLKWFNRYSELSCVRPLNQHEQFKAIREFGEFQPVLKKESRF